jgi:hypothetical protein
MVNEQLTQDVTGSKAKALDTIIFFRTQFHCVMGCPILDIYIIYSHLLSVPPCVVTEASERGNLLM